MELALNDTSIVHTELMDVYTFVNAYKYDIDKLYIDKFWSSIKKKSWIVVDYEMLRWMGYDGNRERSNKQRYYGILKNNFVEGDEYDEVFNNDIRIRTLNGAAIDFKESSQRKVIITTSDTFKMSLMILRTAKANEIRVYYLTLEKIMMDYMEYTHAFTLYQKDIELKNALQYIDKPKFDYNKIPVEMVEHVYILTNRRYFRQSLFKIGMSTKLKERLSTYNTSAGLDDDEMFYICIIPTLNCAGLEKLLHTALSRYQQNKEWFHIPHNHLKSVVDLVVQQQAQLMSLVNFNATESIDAELSLEELANTNQAQPKSNMTCSKCHRVYVNKKPFEKHIISCTGSTCQRCDMVFLSQFDLNRHLQRKTKCIDKHADPNAVIAEDESKPYQCQDCDHRFTTEVRYNNHIREGCPYSKKCEHCSKILKSATALKNHVDSGICRQPAQPMIYKDGFDYRCSTCNKKFRVYKSAMRHANSHKIDDHTK